MIRPMLRTGAITGAVTGALLLGGCAVGPDYVRPSVAIPNAYKEATPTTPGWTSARPADDVPRGPWWQIYGDAQLNALEEQVNVSSQSVQKSIATLKQARAMVDYARAGYFPSLTASANAARTRYSANVIDRATSGLIIPDYALALNATWEPDLWDKIGHTVGAARANAQASAADLEGVRLGIHADVALNYFNLRGLDASEKLFGQTIVAYQQALELTQNRFTIGIASQSDVAQARTQLANAQAQQIDLGVLRAQYEHAIATLIGQPASTFFLPPADASFVPPTIPAGVPSDLLQRRPDIAAAERRTAAANAQIGIAQAAYFPQLMLSATGGLESSAFGNLLTAPSRMWSIGPALLATLFDGGARSAAKASAQAQFEGSVADYRQTVLSAFQEVEDNLAALRILQQEAAKQHEAVLASEQALQHMMNQYKIGSVGYLDVVVTQSTALINERLAVDLDRRQMAASVTLVKALGGKWGSSTEAE
ncbi:MAG: efflux system, outer rane lipoprotein NodT family [Herbaspirillum sp.]|nr:efflux system, outer rane lipoprotein NodT family [Herbaspirillum sp.]